MGLFLFRIGLFLSSASALSLITDIEKPIATNYHAWQELGGAAPLLSWDSTLPHTDLHGVKRADDPALPPPPPPQTNPIRAVVEWIETDLRVNDRRMRPFARRRMIQLDFAEFLLRRGHAVEAYVPAYIVSDLLADLVFRDRTKAVVELQIFKPDDESIAAYCGTGGNLPAEVVGFTDTGLLSEYNGYRCFAIGIAMEPDVWQWIRQNTPISENVAEDVAFDTLQRECPGFVHERVFARGNVGFIVSSRTVDCKINADSDDDDSESDVSLGIPRPLSDEYHCD